jgi:hypothetical protein
MYGKTIAEPGGLTARRAHHRRSAAVHAENGPGDRCGDMALTGPSHRSGKITATTHLPCPLAYTRGSALPTARHRIGRYAHSQQSAPGSPIAPIRQRSARLDGVLSLKVPKPVRVKYPCRARWPSWVSMFRGLTPSRMARSWPLHSRGGWLVMIAVTRSCRVGGRGGAGVVRSRRVRPGLRSRAGVLMVMPVAVMAAGRGGAVGRRRG